jgi:integrase
MAKSTHVRERADRKACVVAFRQSKNKEYPRVFRTFSYKTYGSKEAAWIEAKRFERKQMELQGVGKTTYPDPKKTFREAGERWYQHGLDMTEPWRRSTAFDYRSCLRCLNKAFGDVPIAKLEEVEVERWVARMSEEVNGRPRLSGRTLRKLLFVGDAVFRRAHRDHQGFTRNPFQIEKGTKTGARERPPVYTVEQAEAIVRACENANDTAMILLAWRAGIRRGELAALKVGDVDFNGRTIRVHKNYVHGKTTTPKGKNERHIPLNKSVAVALDKLLKERGDPPDDEFLLLGDDGKQIKPGVIYKRFKAAVKKAGVPDRRLHDLRHTYCSHLAARGVDPWKIQAWAGHASITTTQLYVEWFGPKEEHADTVDAAFDEPADTVDEVFDEPTEPTDSEKLTELQRQVTYLSEQLTQALAR